MATKNIAGIPVEVNEEGYMSDPSQWSREIAVELAKEENIELTEKHFEILEFIRKEYESGVQLTIRKVGKSGIVDIKGLYELFPGGPLKKSSKIAGIPKPASCV
ncbi:MAG: TusE/DsrC/DsvC family sulfur relay protein [Bacteroidales bacterium]|nr:MAG: TusE/DsrC/DsvC family sulfur relay protein [Bacteroidales bacterium]